MKAAPLALAFAALLAASGARAETSEIAQAFNAMGGAARLVTTGARSMVAISTTGANFLSSSDLPGGRASAGESRMP